MTALAGYWCFSNGSEPEQSCARMLNAQRVYAPDPQAEAVWAGASIALGRRLFRTLPEDRFDHVPIVLAYGGSALIADVRLDNREELTAQAVYNGLRLAELTKFRRPPEHFFSKTR